MIYIVTGKYKNAVSFISNRLQEFVQSERRNWRHSVFHIDDEAFKGLLRDDIEGISDLCNFIAANGNDIIISVSIPNKTARETLIELLNTQCVNIHVFSNKKCGKSEILIDDYEEPTGEYVGVELISNILKSFSNLIVNLTEIKRI